MTDHIGRAYFGYQPAARHLPECKRASSQNWEVGLYEYRNFQGDVTQTTIRLVCPDCGAVKFVGFDREASMYQHTSTTAIGYGRPPERIAGLWLHPGPMIPFAEDRGPESFYITQTKDRPESPDDVVGVIGWNRGKRGGTRWHAGTGCTDYGSLKTVVGDGLASKHAAVKAVAAALAAGGAE